MCAPRILYMFLCARVSRQHDALVEQYKRYASYALVFSALMFVYLCLQVVEIATFIPRIGSEYNPPSLLTFCHEKPADDYATTNKGTSGIVFLVDISSNLLTGLLAVFVFNFVLLARTWIGTSALRRRRRRGYKVRVSPQDLLHAPRPSTSLFSNGSISMLRLPLPARDPKAQPASV